MIITGATTEDLKRALARVNERFAGNVCFNRFDTLSPTRHRLTLRVISSKEPGHRLSVPNPWGYQRRLVAACWHLYGHFFDALPADAVIRTSRHTRYPGDTWLDWNVGSIMCPSWYSDCCECGPSEER